MRTAAILPVKRFARAKQRLGERVADPLRRDLAKAMVGDVLATLTSSPLLDMTIVVTNEPSIAACVETFGATIVPDAADEGQSAAVSLGIKTALDAGIRRVLCVPGDCPALDPDDLTLLLGGYDQREAEVVIVPDRHGTGTNGLLLCPPAIISPSFGPGSCERHRELAAAAGVRCLVKRPSSLLLDIDTGEDLDVLRAQLSGETVRAPRTRAVLGRAGERAWEASPSAA